MPKLPKGQDLDEENAIWSGYRCQNCKTVRISVTKFQYGQDPDELTAIGSIFSRDRGQYDKIAIGSGSR
jgi:hypothetical protein